MAANRGTFRPTRKNRGDRTGGLAWIRLQEEVCGFRIGQTRAHRRGLKRPTRHRPATPTLYADSAARSCGLITPGSGEKNERLGVWKTGHVHLRQTLGIGAGDRPAMTRGRPEPGASDCQHMFRNKGGHLHCQSPTDCRQTARRHLAHPTPGSRRNSPSQVGGRTRLSLQPQRAHRSASSAEIRGLISVAANCRSRGPFPCGSAEPPSCSPVRYFD